MSRALNADDFLEQDFRLEAIEGQRNRALADHAIAVGKQRLAEAKAEELEKALAERDERIVNLDLTMRRLTAELVELKKPKEA